MPGMIKIFSILCVLLNQEGVDLALLIIIRTGSTIPKTAQAAKSLPNMKELKIIHKIRIHNINTTNLRVRLIPKTTGKVRIPANLSPIRSSPSFSISLGRLSKKISEAGSTEFFKFRKAADAIAPTIKVRESNKDTAILPIKGSLLSKDVYIKRIKVAARPIFKRLKSTMVSKILPTIKREIEIISACFLFILPDGINLSGLFTSSV
jgi:hypothetical protein